MFNELSHPVFLFVGLLCFAVLLVGAMTSAPGRLLLYATTRAEWPVHAVKRLFTGCEFKRNEGLGAGTVSLLGVYVMTRESPFAVTVTGRPRVDVPGIRCCADQCHDIHL
jgi:hypothetical protein